MAESNNDWRHDDDGDGDQEIDETVRMAHSVALLESASLTLPSRATRRKKMPSFWPLRSASLC